MLLRCCCHCCLRRWLPGRWTGSGPPSGLARPASSPGRGASRRTVRVCVFPGGGRGRRRPEGQEVEKRETGGLISDGEKIFSLFFSLFQLFHGFSHLFGEESTEGVAAEGGSSCGWGHRERENNDVFDLLFFCLSKSCRGEEKKWTRLRSLTLSPSLTLPRPKALFVLLFFEKENALFLPVCFSCEPLALSLFASEGSSAPSGTEGDERRRRSPLDSERTKRGNASFNCQRGLSLRRLASFQFRFFPRNSRVLFLFISLEKWRARRRGALSAPSDVPRPCC